MNEEHHARRLILREHHQAFIIATSHTTRALLRVMVGTLVLMWGIVCSGPRPSGAAQMPINSAAVSSYIKVTTNDKLQNPNSFTCPDGQWLAGQYVKCFSNEQTYTGQCLYPLTDTLDGLPLQNFTAQMCALFPTPTLDGYTEVGTLIDERDGQAYMVRKYSDGHCWLAENLKYGTCDLSAWIHQSVSSAHERDAVCDRQRSRLRGFGRACARDGHLLRIRALCAALDAV